MEPGWHYDEELSCWLRDTIHRMGRRCRNWDYSGKGAYLITLTLADRKSRALGRLALGGPALDSAGAQASARPHIVLSPLGEAVAALVRRIPEFTPELEVLAHQIMPDHLHLVLRARRRLKRPLGHVLRGFKGGASQVYWRLALDSASAQDCARAVKRGSLFSSGFVDNILFDEQAVESAIAYALDNPRRLAEKIAHPELFQVLRDLEMPLRLGGAGVETARFTAIGNRHLLGMPHICQVQCSRVFFEYRRDGQGRLLKDEPPLKATREFEEKREALFAAAEKGAVLVSPCISHGEKELARLAFRAGLRVIVLQNKGFSPLYKPGGRLFDRCAGGNLLMLAPVAWPYQPGEKPMTRQDACILNRLAQAISGPGAVEIRYRGAEPDRVEEAARAAVGLGPRALGTRA